MKIQALFAVLLLSLALLAAARPDPDLPGSAIANGERLDLQGMANANGLRGNGLGRRLLETYDGSTPYALVGTGTFIADASGPTTYTNGYTSTTVKDGSVKVSVKAESYAAGDDWKTKAKINENEKLKADSGTLAVVGYVSASQDGPVEYVTTSVGP